MPKSETKTEVYSAHLNADAAFPGNEMSFTSALMPSPSLVHFRPTPRTLSRAQPHHFNFTHTILQHLERCKIPQYHLPLTADHMTIFTRETRWMPLLSSHNSHIRNAFRVAARDQRRERGLRGWKLFVTSLSPVFYGIPCYFLHPSL